MPVSGGVAHVPVVIQLEALECGAACLDMILEYYGKYVPLAQVREDCGVSRDGSKAKNILRAARTYGLQAQGYRYEPATLMEKGEYPCIIHWNFNHFVVLCGFGKNEAVINDPARGTCHVSLEEFDRSFTGVVLMFRPTEDFVPEGRPKSLWDFARRKLAGTGAAFALVLITTVIVSLIGIITPGFSNVFADHLLTGRDPDWFRPFMWGLAGVVVLQLVAAWIQQVYILKANGKMAITGSSEYMWHVLRLPMAFFSQRSAGDILARKEGNAKIAGSLVSTFAPLLLQCGMMLFYVLVMLRYSILLTLAGLASIIVSLAVSLWISAKRVDIMRVMQRDQGALMGATVTGIEMIESLKAAGAEQGFFRKWAGIQAGVNAGQVRYTRLNALYGLIPSVLSTLSDVFIFAGSVWLCMRGQWTVGMITAFTGFLSSLMSPASQFISATQSFQEMRTDMERIEDVLDYPAAVEAHPQAVDIEDNARKLSGRIELRNVTFGYSRLDSPLIENFSLTVEPGQSVALVGPSGCGKSTLSKLICGLYAPWSGEILFDGRPIGQIPRLILTSSVTVVDQDITLFEDTIANNIRMWDPSIEDFEVILAARDAHIHEDILRREGGCQSRISEGGRDLSGGQRQRIEIARALAQDPTILILDEATSALDAQTEHAVVKSIRDRGITCLVIAHRLSTVRGCDQILVMSHGKVVERGTHAELYAAGGFYTRLVSNQ